MVTGDFSGLALPAEGERHEISELLLSVRVVREGEETKVMVEGQEIRDADAWQAMRRFIGPEGVGKTGVVWIDKERYALDRFSSL